MSDASIAASAVEQCAGCAQPTLAPSHVCPVCLEKVAQFSRCLDDAGIGHDDTVRINALNGTQRRKIAALLLMHPARDARELIDEATAHNPS